MANERNLIPWNKRTENEQREYAKKGGQKSGEVRRQRKAMKEQMEMLLSLPFKQRDQLNFIKELGINEDEIDNQMALIVAMYGKALKGDVQAFNTIREVTQDDKTNNNCNRVEIINDLPKDDEDES